MKILDLNTLITILTFLTSCFLSSSTAEKLDTLFNIEIFKSTTDSEGAPALLTIFWADTQKKNFPLSHSENYGSELILEYKGKCGIGFVSMEFENFPKLQEFFSSLNPPGRDYTDFSDKSTLNNLINRFFNSNNPLKVSCVEPVFSVSNCLGKSVVFPLAQEILIHKFEISFSISISEMGTGKLFVTDIFIFCEGFEFVLLNNIRYSYKLSEMDLFLNKIKEKFPEFFEIEFFGEPLLHDGREILEDTLAEYFLDNKNEEKEIYQGEERHCSRNVIVWGLCGMIGLVAGSVVWRTYCWKCRGSHAAVLIINN